MPAPLKNLRVMFDHHLRRTRKQLLRRPSHRTQLYRYGFFVLLPLVLLGVLTLWRYVSNNGEIVEIRGGLLRGGNGVLKRKAMTDGVGVVMACDMDHENVAVEALLGNETREWDKEIGQFIFVRHWSGEKSQRLDFDRVRAKSDGEIVVVDVVRAKGRGLSRAYNTGMAFLRKSKVIILGCGDRIGDSFLKRHQFAGNRFYIGADWFHGKDRDPYGAGISLFGNSKAFAEVGGFDERMKSRAAVDDLVLRLKYSGWMMEEIDASTIHQRDKTDRIHKPLFADVSLDHEIVLSEIVGKWNGSMAVDNPAYIFKAHRKKDSVVHTLLEVKTGTPDFKLLVTPKKRAEAWKMALGRHLHDKYVIPRDVVLSMTTRAREALVAQLNLKEDQSRSTGMPAGRVLIVHAMHGLGNRLRAFASARTFAEATGRVLILIWDKDAHCRTSFDDLFYNSTSLEQGTITDHTQALIVLDDFIPEWPFDRYSSKDFAWNEMLSFNYIEIEGGKKDEVIKDVPAKHIYFKSAYVMASNGVTGWEKDNKHLKSLVPNMAVMKLVQDCEAKGVRKAIGIHIRSKLLAQDIEGVDASVEYSAKDFEIMEYYRKVSGPDLFIAEMQRLVSSEKQHGSTVFYVASDSQSVRDRIGAIFKDRIIRHDEEQVPCENRGPECMRRALGELLCLARTTRFMGSFWSSYTEAAQRFGAEKALLAGRDFGQNVVSQIKRPESVVFIEEQAMLKRKRNKRKKQNL